MAAVSLFAGGASTSVPGIWLVGRTTPILYRQPNPDEVYLILGYNLGGRYPNRTVAQLGSEAVDPVDADALVSGTAIRFVTELAIRRESAPGAGNGKMRMQMSVASNLKQGAASQPFTPAALARAVMAIQVLPWRTVYRVDLRDLVDATDAFAWLDPGSLLIGADMWSTLSTATEVRTVIFDPEAKTIDAGKLLYDTGQGQPAAPSPELSDLPAIFPAPPAPVGQTANMLWIDIVTQGVSYGPLRDIAAWRQEEIWGQGNRFSFTAVQKGTAARIEAFSEIYVYSLVGGHVTLVGAGLVETFEETPAETETTLAVSGVGFEHELLTQPSVDLSFADTSHAQVVAALAALLPDGWSLMPDPEIQEARLSARIAGKSLLDAVRKCAEFFGTHLQFDFTRAVRMRSYYTPLQIVASNDGGLGARVSHFKRRTHAKEIVTVLHPFASDRKARLADVTDAPADGFELDADAGTVTHRAALDRYGDKHQEHVFRSLVPNDGSTIARRRTANLLLQLSVNRLRQYGEPQETIDIVLQGPRQMVRPFHLLPLRIRNPLVTDEFRVASVVSTFDAADGLLQSMTLTSQQSVRLVDDVSVLARQLKDLVEAADLGPGVAPAVFVGVVTTAFTGNGGGEGTSIYFVADPGDDVTAILEVESAGAGAYEYAVDGRPWQDLPLSTGIDLSPHVAAAGSHRLEVRLTPAPATASRLNARVTVVS